MIEGVTVTIGDGFITDIKPGHVEDDDLLDGILVPGFFDIQVNGGGGILFNDSPSLEGVRAIGDAHRRFGTTAFLPTLISDNMEKIAVAIDAVDQAIAQGVPGVMGIHLEGPFLNPLKKGIHDAGRFRQLSDTDIDMLSSLKQGKTLVTLAPEMVDDGLIQALVEAGVVVSAGHTAATYEQTMKAVDAGITGFTHLFNAMSGFETRAPGAVGAALESQNTWAGLIADGHHVHAAALRHAIHSKGVEKSILVTDAMPTVGSQSKEFLLGEQQIVAEGGRCTNAEGTLAGSDLDMMSAVRFAANEVGVSLEDAVTMASLTPACFMGLDSVIGSLSVGKQADFVLMDSELKTREVWVKGVKQPH